MIKTISRAELEELYHSNTNDNLCKKLTVSKTTLLKYLRNAGIKLKGRPKPKLKVI